MKILLLLMGVYILIQKKTSIKNLFKSKSQINIETKKSYQDYISMAENKLNMDFDDSIRLFNLVVLLLCLFYALFYILSATYINTFLFTLLSVTQILLTFKTISKISSVSEEVCKSIKEESECNFKVPGKLYSFMNLILDFVYIGILFYTIYLNY